LGCTAGTATFSGAAASAPIGARHIWRAGARPTTPRPPRRCSCSATFPPAAAHSTSPSTRTQAQRQDLESCLSRSRRWRGCLSAAMSITVVNGGTRYKLHRCARLLLGEYPGIWPVPKVSKTPVQPILQLGQEGFQELRPLVRCRCSEGHAGLGHA
jgi:hypothetical protein